MEINKCIKHSFSVIGKEGSTNDGKDFIKNLWNDANGHFNEVSSFAKKDDQGNILGIWGAMSDFSKKYNPWEDNFTKGLYLAGVEVVDEAQPPVNWTKWTIPSYEYLYVKVEGDAREIFNNVIKFIKDSNMQLKGAVNDYFCPEEKGQHYMFFPIKIIK